MKKKEWFRARDRNNVKERAGEGGEIKRERKRGRESERVKERGASWQEQ